MRILALLGALLIPSFAGAQKFDADARAIEITPHLDEQTFAFVHLDATRPDAEPLLEMFLAFAVRHPVEQAERKKALGDFLASLKQAGGKSVYFLLTFDDARLRPVVVLPEVGAKGKEAARLARTLFSEDDAPDLKSELHNQTIVLAAGETLRRRKDLRPLPRPWLAKALATAGDTTLQLVLVPTADQRRVFEELMPELPKELGGGAGTILTRGIQWLALGVGGAPKLSLQLTIQSQDAAAAQKLHAWIDSAIKHFGQNPEARQLFPDFDKHAKELLPTVAGDRLTLKLEEKTLTAFLLPLLAKTQEAATRDVAMNNLKQIGLALHNYHDTHKTFPASANYDKDGKALLSWRVHVLPYIEQLDLYQQFKLDEPWDSAHNKKLIAKMPKIYRSPHSKVVDRTKTTYVVPYGKETIFFGAKGTDIRDITDGTSNTIMVVEAADDHAVIWTKPDDLPFDPKQPGKGLLSKERPVFFAAFADGSVRAISAKNNLETLRALFTRNGGEPVGPID
jgi:hypothetical protein